KHDVYQHILATVDASTPEFIVRMAALMHDLGKPQTQAARGDSPGEYSFFRHEQVGVDIAENICSRLKLASAERTTLCALVAGHMFFYTPDWTDGTVRRFVKRVGPDFVSSLFALREADVASRGQGDIARKIVRAVGDPVLRFTEDGLRPMRAVRQAAQLGFALDPDTQAAIPRTLESFRKVSAERIRDELRKLLLAPKPSGGLELMRATGLLAEVLPEMLPTIGCVQNRFHKHDVYQHILATVDASTPEFIVRMAALMHDLGKPQTQAAREDSPGEYSFFRHEQVGVDIAENICSRLKLASAERATLCALVAGHMFFYTPDWTDGTVRRFVKRVGPDLVPSLFALREADVASRGQGEDPQCETRVLRDRIARVAAEDAALRVTDLAIDGKDVMRVLGIPPSRRVGEILEQLLEKVLDDPKLNDRETLEALVRALG
ncbi:MAG TPA: HD domain-containing protein, partial [Polyangia bacterium]